MSWQRVRGHDGLVEAFDRVVQRGRLAHAYFFAGPSGVGKRLFANELAKALLCESTAKSRLEACDHCSACLQVDAGSHPDFFVVSKPPDTVTIPIESMRDLSRDLSHKPARGHGKIAIVDDADYLTDPTTPAAANAFLKTLEEPPPRSVLILIGTDSDLQLPTIISRCQIVRFSAVARRRGRRAAAGGRPG